MKYNIGDKVLIARIRYSSVSIRKNLVDLEGIVVSYRDTKEIPLCENEITTGDVAMYRVHTEHQSERYTGTTTFWEDELVLIKEDEFINDTQDKLF